jgi:hypothetical protein
MKSNLKLLSIVIVILIYGGASNLLAQMADTVTVTGTGANGAIMPGDLYKFINSDTLADGQRAHPNRFYRLERGKVYVINGTMYFRYSVNMIADEDNPGNPTRPPVLVNGKMADGSNNQIIIGLMRNKTNFIFKNIFFQGVSIDKREEDDNNAISIAGDSIRLTVEKCVFNALGMQNIVMWGKGNKLYIRDNIFRNGVRAHPFKGQIISNSGVLYQDTLIMTNNSSFNNNSYFWAPLSAVVRYEKIEHNTLYSSVVNVFYSPWMLNSEIKSNLFYGMLAYGQTQTEVDGGWYDFNKSLSSIISINRASAFQLGLHGFTEGGRKINVSNNTYFWPQKIKDNWTSLGVIASDLWMNTRTTGYFNDKNSYPNLLETNNISADPGFDAQMETIVMDSLVNWVKNFRTKNISTYRNYNVGSTNLLLPTWPLPENLAYSNMQLKTAGHDGLPVGDLNWFPEAKRKWEELNSTSTGIHNRKADNQGMKLTCYPNPVSHSTTISFNLTRNEITLLRILNLQGKEVAKIVEGSLEQGLHSWQFDVSGLTSGVYVCQLISGENSEKIKLIIAK